MESNNKKGAGLRGPLKDLLCSCVFSPLHKSEAAPHLQPIGLMSPQLKSSRGLFAVSAITRLCALCDHTTLRCSDGLWPMVLSPPDERMLCADWPRRLEWFCSEFVPNECVDVTMSLQGKHGDGFVDACYIKRTRTLRIDLLLVCLRDAG